MADGQSARPVFRFAPSPNGNLHLGHALSALLNGDAAKACGGRFLLRIEDIDPARCRPEYEAAILEDLAWLGLEWEEPVRRQSEHVALYRRRLDALRARGLLYPCFCSRRALAQCVEALEKASGKAWRRDPDGAPLYPGTCRGLSADLAARRIADGEPHAWRLPVARASAACGVLAWHEHEAADPASPSRLVPADPLAWGDVILDRRDAPASYHLAVVTDDAAQGITQVVRGEDLAAATAIHRLLQRLLGLPEPGYHHHRLIRDEEGRKLSKSIASTALRALRTAGATSRDIRMRVGLAG